MQYCTCSKQIKNIFLCTCARPIVIHFIFQLCGTSLAHSRTSDKAKCEYFPTIWNCENLNRVNLPIKKKLKDYLNGDFFFQMYAEEDDGGCGCGYFCTFEGNQRTIDSTFKLRKNELEVCSLMMLLWAAVLLLSRFLTDKLWWPHWRRSLLIRRSLK